jgi:hypothetical protein
MWFRGLKAFGNWCDFEELAAAAGFRALRRPHVPHELIAPFSTGELQRLLALADPRERALSCSSSTPDSDSPRSHPLRVGDLRPDGTIRVLGKGSKERIVPLGTTARRALLCYVAGRDPVGPADPLFIGRHGAPLSRRGIQYAFARPPRRRLSAPARTPSATSLPAATSLTATTYSASSRSSATRHSTWSAGTSVCPRPISWPGIGRPRPRIDWPGGSPPDETEVLTTLPHGKKASLKRPSRGRNLAGYPSHSGRFSEPSFVAS